MRREAFSLQCGHRSRLSVHAAARAAEALLTGLIAGVAVTAVACWVFRERIGAWLRR